MGKPFMDDGGFIWTLIGFLTILWLVGGSFISDYKHKSDRRKKYFVGIFATKVPVKNGMYGFNLVPNLEGETLEFMGENALDRDLIGAIRGVNSDEFIERLEGSLKIYYEEAEDYFVIEEKLFIKLLKIYSREYKLVIY